MFAATVKRLPASPSRRPLCNVRAAMSKARPKKKKSQSPFTEAGQLKRLKDPDFKYEMYEASVQDPEGDVDRSLVFFDELVGRTPSVFREDFCGTFKISAAWVKREKHHAAIGVDLDPEPIASGMRRHFPKLDASQQSRLDIREADVREVTTPPADIALAGNFSSFIFKTPETMLAYLTAVRESLADDGILVLEIAGGPGLIETQEESRGVYDGDHKWFTYIWDQQSFNPINHDALYAIHFELKGGHRVADAFVYDWRLWTIPELRDLLQRAGFVDSVVYWEQDDEDEDGDGYYAISEKAGNDPSWLCYVVGMKSERKSKRRSGTKKKAS